VEEAVKRLEALRDVVVSDSQGTANLETFLGGLFAQLGEFERARVMINSARGVLEDLGQRAQSRTYSATVLGEVELLAGNALEAERVLRELCEELERSSAFSHLASTASDLAEALVMQDRIEEAERWAGIAQRHSAHDDVQAEMMWRTVRARVEARKGALERAERLARDAVAVADTTDDLNRRAKAYWSLGETLRRGQRGDEANTAHEHAMALYMEKGNRAAVERLRQQAQALVSV